MSLVRLSFLGLLLLAQTGCSTHSLRNLFTWNRKGDPQTVAELDARKSETDAAGRSKSEPVKTASWNPFRRGEAEPQAAGASRPDVLKAADDTSIAASEKQSPLLRNPFSGEETSCDDPFLQDESARERQSGLIRDDEAESSSGTTAKSSERPIRRTAGAVASSTDKAEMAEPLIATKSSRSTEQPPRSALEAQKLAELDALLDGRELAGARQAGRDAAAKSSRTAKAAESSAADAIRKARETAESRKQAAQAASRDLQKSLADAELVFEEASTPPKAARTQAASTDRAEPLILRRPQTKRAVAKTDAADAAEDDEPTQTESDEDTGVASAETLFGDTASKPPVRSGPADFGWKSSESSPSTPAGKLRLAGLQRESAADEDEQIPTLAPAENSPIFDEPQLTDPLQHAPTPGNRIRENAFQPADPFIAAPAPQQTVQPAPVPAEPQDRADESDFGSPKGSVAAPPTTGGSGGLSGLSIRTWCLAAGGAVVLGLLFLPGRRRTAIHQTTVGQTSIA
jgi:hypothetical protein